MTLVPIRGAWTVSKAVRDQWIAANLDNRFRASWGSQAASGNFQPWNDTTAQPAKGTGERHPVPYVIFTQDDPKLQFRTSGETADTIKEVHDVLFNLTVYHATKSQAVATAKMVAAAFDRMVLPIEDDDFVTIFRDADFGTKEADETWSWTLAYRMRIEVTYAADLQASPPTS